MFNSFDPWGIDRLHRLLSGGFNQFRLKTAQGVVFQGQIAHFEISRDPKNIKIHFEWLCERRSFSSDVNSRLITWSEITDIESKFLIVSFRRYYPQRARNKGKKPHRERRVKLKGSMFKLDTRNDEECWFYMDSDPEALRKVGDRYLTESMIPKLTDF